MTELSPNLIQPITAIMAVVSGLMLYHSCVSPTGLTGLTGPLTKIVTVLDYRGPLFQKGEIALDGSCYLSGVREACSSVSLNGLDA